ncbi:hypothetical protein AUC71_10465 [Methyloceanibacter marginalis]|uniref:Uncharacterized protein n=1 Tax=Methyloceanibacter marginalis TaxID=1774971 RepID=A0A1E3WBT7_9HYPH|nr:hypothetical protein [Methyloceanibacter marginalis]ODS03279.1 hypothetical protein AUC71_10465 [Methyloceanibacter marginalis]
MTADAATAAEAAQELSQEALEAAANFSIFTAISLLVGGFIGAVAGGSAATIATRSRPRQVSLLSRDSLARPGRARVLPSAGPFVSVEAAEPHTRQTVETSWCGRSTSSP